MNEWKSKQVTNTPCKCRRASNCVSELAFTDDEWRANVAIISASLMSTLAPENNYVATAHALE